MRATLALIIRMHGGRNLLRRSESAAVAPPHMPGPWRLARAITSAPRYAQSVPCEEQASRAQNLQGEILMKANDPASDKLLIREDTRGIVTLTLNRPQQLNALSEP